MPTKVVVYLPTTSTSSDVQLSRPKESTQTIIGVEEEPKVNAPANRFQNPAQKSDIGPLPVRPNISIPLQNSVSDKEITSGMRNSFTVSSNVNTNRLSSQQQQQQQQPPSWSKGEVHVTYGRSNSTVATSDRITTNTGRIIYESNPFYLLNRHAYYGQPTSAVPNGPEQHFSQFVKHHQNDQLQHKVVANEFHHMPSAINGTTLYGQMYYNTTVLQHSKPIRQESANISRLPYSTYPGTSGSRGPDIIVPQQPLTSGSSSGPIESHEQSSNLKRFVSQSSEHEETLNSSNDEHVEHGGGEEQNKVPNNDIVVTKPHQAKIPIPVPVPVPPSKCSEPKRRDNSQKKRSFDEWFGELVAYKVRYQLKTIGRIRRGEEYTHLNKWSRNIRHSYKVLEDYKKGKSKPARRTYKLTPESIQRLQDIGFQFTPETDEDTFEFYKSFDQWYAELIEYKKIFGDCNVPEKKVAACNDDGVYIPLGRWCSFIRQRYKEKASGKNTTLNDSQVEDLNKIGFRWRFVRTFDERFEDLKEYMAKFGDCNVPTPEQGDNKYRSLHNWTCRLRRSYKAKFNGELDTKEGIHKLTDQNVADLEEIGFLWITDRSKSQRNRRAPHRTSPIEKNNTSETMSSTSSSTSSLPDDHNDSELKNDETTNGFGSPTHYHNYTHDESNIDSNGSNKRKRVQEECEDVHSRSFYQSFQGLDEDTSEVVATSFHAVQ